MTTAQDITMNIMKDTARVVDFTQMIQDQQKFVRNARNIAGSKPTKVEQAYIDLQVEKLNQLEDIVKRWIWEAFSDDKEVASKTMYWHGIQENYKISVVVEELKP